MADEVLLRSPGMTRRDFLKLSLFALLGGASLAIMPPILRRVFVGETKNIVDPDIYFASKGIRFETVNLGLSDRNVNVNNGSGMEVDFQNLKAIFDYFAKIQKNPFKYQLTRSSKEVNVTPSTAKWQKKGSIKMVSFDAGLPPQLAHCANMPNFTDYSESGDYFTTYIRIPSEDQAKKYGFVDIQHAVQASTIVEAAQASVYVNIEGSTGLEIPPGEERFLAQEAYANSFWYVNWHRQKNTPYSPLLFAKQEFPSNPISSGKILNLRSIFLDQITYDSLPTDLYLGQKTFIRPKLSGKKSSYR